jgi:hypothetical protein
LLALPKRLREVHDLHIEEDKRWFRREQERERVERLNKEAPPG